jgi:hypothetical protein
VEIGEDFPLQFQQVGWEIVRLFSVGFFFRKLLLKISTQKIFPENLNFKNFLKNSPGYFKGRNYQQSLKKSHHNPY